MLESYSQAYGGSGGGGRLGQVYVLQLIQNTLYFYKLEVVVVVVVVVVCGVSGGSQVVCVGGDGGGWILQHGECGVGVQGFSKGDYFIDKGRVLKLVCVGCDVGMVLK